MTCVRGGLLISAKQVTPASVNLFRVGDHPRCEIAGIYFLFCKKRSHVRASVLDLFQKKKRGLYKLYYRTVAFYFFQLSRA